MILKEDESIVYFIEKRWVKKRDSGERKANADVAAQMILDLKQLISTET